MAERYRLAKTKVTNTGSTVYVTKKYPTIPLQATDLYVATQDGDRLDLLAWKYYNDVTLWWIIASANNIKRAPYSLKPGLVLRIPQDWIQIVSNLDN